MFDWHLRVLEVYLKANRPSRTSLLHGLTLIHCRQHITGGTTLQEFLMQYEKNDQRGRRCEIDTGFCLRQLKTERFFCKISIQSFGSSSPLILDLVLLPANPQAMLDQNWELYMFWSFFCSLSKAIYSKCMICLLLFASRLFPVFRPPGTSRQFQTAPCDSLGTSPGKWPKGLCPTNYHDVRVRAGKGPF